MARQQVTLDPAIAAIVKDGSKRERRRGMTGAQRKQAKRDGGRQRVNLELDPQVVEMLKEIAGAEGCSPAGVVNVLVVEAVQQYVDGGVDFSEQRRPSRSARYEWVVELNGRVGLLVGVLREFLERREI